MNFMGNYPDLLFFAFLDNSKENHQRGKDLFLLAEPRKSLGKKGKRSRLQGI